MRTLLLIGCFFIVFNGTAQDVKTQILEVNRAMENTYNEGNVEALASFYAQEGIIVGNNVERMGREAIREYWKNLEGRHIDWELENIEVLVYADVVVQRGISRLQYYHEGTAVQSDVRFTLVWIKEDGDWKIKIDHYTRL
jgi:uncharacterized protein (TIGR02246 family)